MTNAVKRASNHDFECRIFVDESRPSARIRTLVADHDPIWRHVLTHLLRNDDRVDVVADVDSHRPWGEWPLRQVDVAVVGLSHGELLAGAIRQLVAVDVAVVLIGLDWGRRNIDAALSAGAAGCLTKTTDLRGVVSSVQAAADGNRVLSAELLDLYVQPPAARPQEDRRSQRAMRRLTQREREVLCLLGEGLSTGEVAKRCGVSNATVKSHVSHALGKLGARNRLEAVLMVKDALEHMRPCVDWGSGAAAS